MCREKQNTHLHKTNFCASHRFSRQQRVKSVKIVTPRTHCPEVYQYHPFALIFRTGLIFYFIITWKFHEGHSGRDFQPTMLFLEMNINYSYQQRKKE